jgi:hypothetical protein
MLTRVHNGDEEASAAAAAKDIVPTVDAKHVAAALFVARKRRSRGPLCGFNRSPASAAVEEAEMGIVRTLTIRPYLGRIKVAPKRDYKRCDSIKVDLWFFVPIFLALR